MVLMGPGMVSFLHMQKVYNDIDRSSNVGHNEEAKKHQDLLQWILLDTTPQVTHFVQKEN